MDFQKIIDAGKAAQAAANALQAVGLDSLTLGDGTVVTIKKPFKEVLRDYGKSAGIDPKVVDQAIDNGPFGFNSFAHASQPTVRAGDYVEATIPVRVVAPAPRTAEQITPQFLRSHKQKANLPAELLRGGGVQLKVVGAHYRPGADKDSFQTKSAGAMVVVVREPDNGFDKNALAVYIWDRDDRRWAKVGYVQKALNANLAQTLRDLGPGYVYEGQLLEAGRDQARFELTNLLKYSLVPEQLL